MLTNYYSSCCSVCCDFLGGAGPQAPEVRGRPPGRKWKLLTDVPWSVTYEPNFHGGHCGQRMEAVTEELDVDGWSQKADKEMS